MAAAASRSLPYCLALLPVSVAVLAVAASGRAQLAVGWWTRLCDRLLRVPPVPARRQPGTPAVVGHALLSMLVGATALVPVGMEALVLARSVLYGLVDRGPYTDAWGGPTLVGAWLVHLAVGVPTALVGLLAPAGIATVHQRLTRALYGERRARRLVAMTIVIAASGAVLLVAWLRQLPS